MVNKAYSAENNAFEKPSGGRLCKLVLQTTSLLIKLTHTGTVK